MSVPPPSGSSSSSLESLLAQALAATDDPEVKKVLAAQAARAAQAAQQAAPPAALSAEDAVRKAAGAWRDASTKHDQAVNQVVRCRENLRKAEQKEKEMATYLAEAELQRKSAAQVLHEA
eukprot:6232930-Pyramimonas_sp.AAC.1